MLCQRAFAYFCYNGIMCPLVKRKFRITFPPILSAGMAVSICSISSTVSVIFKALTALFKCSGAVVPTRLCRWSYLARDHAIISCEIETPFSSAIAFTALIAGKASSGILPGTLYYGYFTYCVMIRFSGISRISYVSSV